MPVTAAIGHHLVGWAQCPPTRIRVVPVLKTVGVAVAAACCPQYNIEEVNKGGDYYGSENDGYYNSDEEYYSDAYDQ